MKKFELFNAIENGDQLIICETASGMAVNYEKIYFVKETASKRLVFETEEGKKVTLKAGKFDANEFECIGKNSDCFVKLMSCVYNNNCRINYYEKEGVVA